MSSITALGSSTYSVQQAYSYSPDSTSGSGGTITGASFNTTDTVTISQEAKNLLEAESTQTDTESDNAIEDQIADIEAQIKTLRQEIMILQGKAPVDDAAAERLNRKQAEMSNLISQLSGLLAQAATRETV